MLRWLKPSSAPASFENALVSLDLARYTLPLLPRKERRLRQLLKPASLSELGKLFQVETQSGAKSVLKHLPGLARLT